MTIIFPLEICSFQRGKKKVCCHHPSYDVIHLHMHCWSLQSKTNVCFGPCGAKWALSTMLLFLRGIYSWLSALLRERSCCQTNTKMSTATMAGPVPEIIIHCVDSHTSGGRAAKVPACHQAFRVQCLIRGRRHMGGDQVSSCHSCHWGGATCLKTKVPTGVKICH